MTFTIGQEHYCFPSLRGFINFDFSILCLDATAKGGVLRFDSTVVRFTPNFPAFRFSSLSNEFEDIATKFQLLPQCWLAIMHTTREKCVECISQPTHTILSITCYLSVSLFVFPRLCKYTGIATLLPGTVWEPYSTYPLPQLQALPSPSQTLDNPSRSGCSGPEESLSQNVGTQ